MKKKRNVKKRWIAFLTVAALVTAMLPATVLADTEDEAGAGIEIVETTGTQEKTTGEEVTILCTQSEACEAETHEEGCPLYEEAEEEVADANEEDSGEEEAENSEDDLVEEDVAQNKEDEVLEEDLEENPDEAGDDAAGEELEITQVVVDSVFSLFAEEEEATTTVDSWAECTACSEENPHLISSKDDLDKIRTHVSADGTITGYFKLTDDITFTEEDFAEDGDFYNDGHGFEPLGVFKKPASEGSSTETHSFSGAMFDGNGYTISGLVIKNDGTYGQMTGLFGHVNNGSVIKNLTLDDCTIEYTNTATTTSDYATTGVLAGYVFGATTAITNCNVQSSTVRNTSPIDNGVNNGTGAIAGRLCTGPTASGCVVDTVTIESSFAAGGICGISAGGNIEKCVVKGTSISGMIIGGVVGNAGNSAYSITDTYADSTLKLCSSAIGDTDYMVGGIAGRGWNGITVSNCAVLAEIDLSTSSSNAILAGGLLGYDHDGGTVLDTYWNVSYKNVSDANCQVGAAASSTANGGNCSAYTNCTYVKYREDEPVSWGSNTYSSRNSVSLNALMPTLSLSYGTEGYVFEAGKTESTGISFAAEDTSIATVGADGAVTTVSVGDTNIDASVTINGTEYALLEIAVTVMATKVSVTMSDITVEYDANSHTIEAVSNDNSEIPSDLSLVYSYKESTAYDSTYTSIPPTAPGTYIVKVESGNSNYELTGTTTATLTITNTNTLADVSDNITVTAPGLTYDGSAQDYSASYSDMTFIYTYYDANGELLDAAPVDVGDYIVVITGLSSTSYAVRTIDFTVKPATQSISYATTSITKTVGDAAFTNSLTSTGTIFGMITYESSDTSVATVNASTGEVTIVGVGTATITATVSGDGVNYTEATATYTLTISLAAGEYSDNTVGDIEGVTADIPVEQLLTDSDRSQIAQGYDVEFVLSLYDYNEDVPAADVAKITKEAGSGLLSVFYMNINLTKYIYQPDGTLDSENALKDQLAAAVSITVPIPDSMLEEVGTTSGTYYVIRLHDGEAETLEAEYDSENQTATFETDRFSTYALVFIKTGTTETNTSTTETNTSTTETTASTTETTASTTETTASTTETSASTTDATSTTTTTDTTAAVTTAASATTSAKTGDTNPVLPLAGTCVAALVLIAVLAVVRRRKHI